MPNLAHFHISFTVIGPGRYHSIPLHFFDQWEDNILTESLSHPRKHGMIFPVDFSGRRSVLSVASSAVLTVSNWCKKSRDFSENECQTFALWHIFDPVLTVIASN